MIPRSNETCAMRDFCKCLLPWNCVVGACLTVLVLKLSFDVVDVRLSILRAIGVLCMMLAVRQLLLIIRLTRQRPPVTTAPNNLLICGYMSLAFSAIVLPDLPWNSNVTFVTLFGGAVGLMLVGAVLGNKAQCRMPRHVRPTDRAAS